jgi:uncharacterized coiled-coil DUF342 family protein
MADEIQKPPQIANENLTAPDANDNPRSGVPIIPAKALSVTENTSTGTSNKNLAHVCDISGSMKYNIALVSLQIKELIESIRQAIQKLWEGTSNSPFGEGATAIVEAIKKMVKQINKLIEKAKEVQSAVNGYITQLQELLNYIKTLPQRISKMLSDCIRDATNSIKDAIANAKTIVDSQNSANTSASAASSQLTTAENQETGSSSGPKFELA